MQIIRLCTNYYNKEEMKSMKYDIIKDTVGYTSDLLHRIILFSLDFQIHMNCSQMFTIRAHLYRQKVLYVIRNRPTTPLNKMSIRNLDHKPKREHLMP